MGMTPIDMSGLTSVLFQARLCCVPHTHIKSPIGSVSLENPNTFKAAKKWKQASIHGWIRGYMVSGGVEEWVGGWREG